MNGKRRNKKTIRWSSGCSIHLLLFGWTTKLQQFIKISLTFLFQFYGNSLSLVLHHWLSSYFSYWWGSHVLTFNVMPGSKIAGGCCQSVVINQALIWKSGCCEREITRNINVFADDPLLVTVLSKGESKTQASGDVFYFLPHHNLGNYFCLCFTFILINTYFLYFGLDTLLTNVFILYQMAPPLCRLQTVLLVS